jgi:hypothetical protein
MTFGSPNPDSYNPSSFVLVGSTTYVSGSVSDLASNDGVYMAFRAYASSTSNLIVNNGFESAGTWVPAYAYGGSASVQDSAQKHSGAYSGKTDTTSPEGANCYAQLSQSLTPTAVYNIPNTEASLSLWLRNGGSALDDYYYVEVQVASSQGRTLHYRWNLGKSTTEQFDWVEYKPTAKKYNVSFRVKDWDRTDSIPGAIVYLDSSTRTSDSNGWANFTNVSGGTYAVKVKYYGFWVNGTFTLTVSANTIVDPVRCKLYDVTFAIKDSVGDALVIGANVTVYNATGAAGSKIKTGIANSTGKARLTNLPNGTLAVVVYDRGLTQHVIANVTRTVTSDEQAETVNCDKNKLDYNVNSIIIFLALAVPFRGLKERASRLSFLKLLMNCGASMNSGKKPVPFFFLKEKNDGGERNYENVSNNPR